jgi:NADH:ubiquinone oxidoreductase subunit 3 (subunit A)
MYPKIFLILLPLALLCAAVIAIFLWDRSQRGPKQLEAGNGKSEGTFRGFYHALWILVLWSGLALSLPLWFSFKQKVFGMPQLERLIVIGKIVVFPVILLMLLSYGARQGYLKWIDSLEWPDKENR